MTGVNACLRVGDFVNKKGKAVGEFVNERRFRARAAMRGFLKRAEQDWPLRVVRGLESGSHLARVHGVDAIVVFGRDQKNARVGRSLLNMVIRRISEKLMKLHLVLRRAVFGNPGWSLAKEGIANHIEQGNLTHRGAEKL